MSIRLWYLIILFLHMATCLTTESGEAATAKPTIGAIHPSLRETKALTADPTLRTKPTVAREPGTRVGGKEPPKTDAPMLNYIFDAHSAKGKHHHHDYKWGPHFDESDLHLNGSTVTVQIGSTAVLNCRVIYLQDKTVSWIRRKDLEGLELLTLASQTYSGDDRYTVLYQYPGNWRLQISLVKKRDEGLYECQISTHPPKVIQIYLYINAPEVVIVDEHGAQLSDKYYEADSTIRLSCIVRHVAMTSSVVHWLHGNRTLNYDITRGGISVKTDLMEEGANSTLSVARVNGSDSGNYTCSISPTEFATVAVHVLNESLAELHHGSRSAVSWSMRLSLAVACVLLPGLVR